MKRDFSHSQNCVCFNLRWASRVITNFFDAELKKLGIRTTQGTILAALNAKEVWTMAELSEALELERTTLLRNLRPLQRNEWVTAVGSGRGGRVELAITAKGRKQIEALTPAWQKSQRAVVETLGEKRWAAILTDLETAAAALSK